MTPLPPPLGPGALAGWRLDKTRHAATWDSGQGAWLGGGRWNPKGVRAVYACLDPAAAILEVAVHTGFALLDTVPHVMTSFRIDPTRVHVVQPGDVPNPNWLRPGAPGAGQQAFGAALLRDHDLVLIPSAVSPHSWNVVFDPAGAAGGWTLLSQEPFALDTRLNPVR